MIENKCSGSSSAITEADLVRLESAIGKKLPTPFRNHYLKYNGGIPERTYWQTEDFGDPVETSVFKPISDGESTVLSTYQLMLKKSYPCTLSSIRKRLGR